MDKGDVGEVRKCESARVRECVGMAGVVRAAGRPPPRPSPTNSVEEGEFDRAPDGDGCGCPSQRVTYPPLAGESRERGPPAAHEIARGIVSNPQFTSPRVFW